MAVSTANPGQIPSHRVRCRLLLAAFFVCRMWDVGGEIRLRDRSELMQCSSHESRVTSHVRLIASNVS
jgi:hypothetical protein